MKTYFSLFVIAAIISIFFFSCQNPSDPATENLDKPGDCVTIPSGLLVNSQGDPITTGFTEFGYNYQAHIYNGDYGYEGWNLVMKWNDAWLSNKDCDDDGLLDRHLNYITYKGSGAWCTNHWRTTYIDANGNVCEYDDFIKIIAVPLDAEKVGGIWYNADGIEIGADIWGEFAIVQSIINDPCAGVEGIDYKSPDHPGLGNW